MNYLCYDTALNEGYTLLKLQEAYPNYISLFAGTDDCNLWDAAPFLFELKNNVYELKENPLIQLDQCIIFKTNDDLKMVLNYLQSKMYVTKDDRQQYFRIWDARVLVNYLKFCDKIEFDIFFEVFQSFYTEQDEQNFFHWQLKGGEISSTVVSKSDALPAIKSQDELDQEAFGTVAKGDTAFAEKKMDIIQEQQLKEQVDIEPKGKRRKFFLD